MTGRRRAVFAEARNRDSAWSSGKTSTNGRVDGGFLSSVTLGDVVNRRNFALEVSVRRAIAEPGAIRPVEH